MIKIFEMSGVDMKDFSRKARSRDFKAVSLGLTATVSVENEIKRDVSKNVVAQITGTTRPDEAIVYTAHWDHLGVGQVVDGDSIYNGAMDNASGTSVMLGIAERMIREGIRPERSIVFLAVTAEEQGLLGSKYYAENPTFPPEKMIANLNIDGASYFGPMKDLTVIGYGQSELDDLAKQVAESQGRYVKPDPDAGKGYFFRSDHFNFAKIGVPALYASADYEAVDGGVELIETMKTKYLNERYHRPADEFEAVPWRFGGLYQDGNLYYEVGLRLANSEVFPRWKEGSEFKNLRE
ncbi:MAG: M28 family metallopeptidase [Bacteroidota bacterium]